MTTRGGSLGEAILDLGVDASKLEGGMQKAQESSLKRAQSIGKTLTKTLTAGVVAAAAVVFAATESMDQAFKTIRTGTGATGKAMEGLKNDFKAVLGTVNASSQEVAQTIADLNTRLGLVGEPLQEVARNALELGADVNKLAQGMRIFGVETDKAVPYMDELFVLAQKTGIGINQLLTEMQEYGPVLKNAGFEAGEAARFFGELNAEGISASRVMPAMNMFMRKAATEGVEDLKGALFGVIEQMRGASTEAEALSIATEAFGAEGAQRMTTAVRNGAFAFEDLEVAMANSSGAIMENAEATRTNTERFKMLREEVGERVAGAFAALPAPLQLASAGFAGILASAGPLLVALPTIVSGIKAMNIAHKAGIVITKAAAVAQWLLNAALTANPIGIIVVAIGAVIAAGVLLYKHWDKVRRFAEFVWQKIGGQVEWVVNNVIIRALNMMTFVGRQAIAGLIDMAKTMIDLAPGANKWGDAMAEAADKIRAGIPTIDIHTQKTGEMSEAMDESAMSAEEAARLIGGDGAGEYTGSIKKADEATGGLIRTAGKLAVTMRDQYAAVNSATLEYAGFKRELAATAERARELALANSEVAKTTLEHSYAVTDLKNAEQALVEAEAELNRVLNDGTSSVQAMETAKNNAMTASRSLASAVTAEASAHRANAEAIRSAAQAHAEAALASIAAGKQDRINLALAGPEQVAQWRDEALSIGRNPDEYAREMAAAQAAASQVSTPSAPPTHPGYGSGSGSPTADIPVGASVQELMVWATENLQAPNAQDWVDVPWNHVRQMAAGGIVMSPTMAMIGEGGPEAVVPLPKGGLNGMGGLTVYIQGDVLNGEDFYEKVNEARLEFKRRGN